MPATDTVLEDLSKVAATRVAAGDDAVCGVPARWVCSPRSTDEVSEALRLAGQHDLAVVARGAGTKLDWGLPPRAADLVLALTGLSGVVEHAAGDLVVVARAGTPMAELQETVANAGQRLALDVPLPGTVGGALATGVSGPRRLLYGTLRDLLIGVTFVRADGAIAKAGGKVVKNVAGYDFGKLLTGSYGTLGVITEAVFRLHPLPRSRRVVSLRCADATAAGEAALRLVGSQLVPTAVELSLEADGSVGVTALLEGVEEGVRERAETAVALLGSDATVADRLPESFGRYPFTGGGSDTGLKVTASLRGVGPVLAAAVRLAGEQGVAVAGGGSAAGVLHLGLPEDAPPESVRAVVEGVRAAAAPYDGTVTVLTAPPSVREAVDMWGPVAGLHLMRRLKDELDPTHRLSPGRFVGGI